MSTSLGLIFSVLAYVSIVPIGWLLARLLIPDVRSTSAQWALIVTSGYCASVLIGFFCGVAGIPRAYLPVCFVFFAIMLALYAYENRHEAGGIIPLLSLAHWWPSALACVGGALVALGILATAPMMVPIQQVSPSLYMDYSFIDAYFMTARAHVLMSGAPAYTLVDLAGAVPYVYPDFHLFWIGQLSRWSGIDVNSVYLVYAPIVLIGSYTATMYALGRELTRSHWGAFIAASLPYVLLLSDFHDIEPWRINPSLMHFLDVRTALSHGVAGMLIAAVALIASMSLRHSYPRRTLIGLMTMAGGLTVFLVRLRPHFFFALAPWYGLYVLLQVWRRRDVFCAAPLVIVGLLFGVIYLESTSSHYNPGSSHLALAYGLFSNSLMKTDHFPGLLGSGISFLPASFEPVAASALFSVVWLLGTVFTLILTGYAILVVSRRVRLSAVETGLVGVWVTAIALSSIVVLDERRNVGGDWGLQALIIAGPLAQILAIVPIYYALRALATRIPSLMDHRHMLAVGALVLATIVTYRGADAVLRSQLARAYPITVGEMSGYDWLRANTPPTAVVAAHPEHQLNAFGETVASTSFLGGHSRRPVYLQRFAEYVAGEATRRRRLLARLFDAATVEEVKAAVDEATFNYLLVYPDKPPRTDLSCCLTPVYKEKSGAAGLRIYRREK